MTSVERHNKFLCHLVRHMMMMTILGTHKIRSLQFELNAVHGEKQGRIRVRNSVRNVRNVVRIGVGI